MYNNSSLDNNYILWVHVNSAQNKLQIKFTLKFRPKKLIIIKHIPHTTYQL